MMAGSDVNPPRAISRSDAEVGILIRLTRLNQSPFVLNAELIRTVEETPDTTITLTTGERMMVAESMDEVVRRSVEYGRSLRRLMPED